MTLLNIIGNMEGNYTGYGIHIRGLWNALQRIKSDQIKYNFTETSSIESIAASIEISRSFPGQVINIAISVGPSNQILSKFNGLKISYTVFETDKLPDDWTYGLNHSDYVITASDWGRQIMINCGVQSDKVFVIPEGVDTNVFHRYGGTVSELNSSAFKFLMIGKYESRKGYDVLIESFCEAFKEGANVELWLKADSFGDPNSLAEFKSDIARRNLNNIKLINGHYDDMTMAAVYRSCDAFVFPSKGEGWGLPLIEAIACGIPVITTYISGHSEYLNHIKGLFLEIDSKLTPLPVGVYEKYFNYRDGAGNWYMPDSKSLARKLVECMEFPRDNAIKASDIISRNFSWDSSARKLLDLLCLIK